MKQIVLLDGRARSNVRSAGSAQSTPQSPRHLGTNSDEDDYQPEVGFAVGMWIIALELALALAAISWWTSSASA